MTILVTGGTGATGRLLIRQLLEREHTVLAVVRSAERLEDEIRNHPKLITIESPILDMEDSEMAGYLKDCDGAASCLGHNLTIRGIFGPPRKLVRDAAVKVCRSASSRDSGLPFKFVLMNTTANLNRNLNEERTFGESLVISLMRLLVPPQSDNEEAAEYFRKEIGNDNKSIEWVAVRPDTLIDEPDPGDYDLSASPVRSPVFNPGRTSRINVAHFIAELLTREDLWEEWKGQMPVIYNRDK
ncbi:NAD(P)-dependent oxidoreductase [Spirochaeta isovalerica]|uniref:NAD(P)-binding domain-containing protein n=1 Tax=Spirochaeta isovalerica TaxID=150 RepID=A0A841R9V0_9SPIO|nr:NAD(P)-binding oxidoreductase [Spirochaeta isovalerica]MBB6480141.1 hypothetical protein [Spirochaeta isovalerica]